MNISARKPHTSDDYWNLPYDVRAELINGELYAMSPPTRMHQRIVTRVAQQLQNHIDTHGGPLRGLRRPLCCQPGWQRKHLGRNPMSPSSAIHPNSATADAKERPT